MDTEEKKAANDNWESLLQRNGHQVIDAKEALVAKALADEWQGVEEHQETVYVRVA